MNIKLTNKKFNNMTNFYTFSSSEIEKQECIKIEGVKFIATIKKPGLFKNKILAQAESDDLVDLMYWVYRNNDRELEGYKSYTWFANEIYNTWLLKKKYFKIKFTTIDCMWGLSYTDPYKIYEIEAVNT